MNKKLAEGGQFLSQIWIHCWLQRKAITQLLMQLMVSVFVQQLIFFKGIHSLNPYAVHAEPSVFCTALHNLLVKGGTICDQRNQHGFGQ